MPNWKKVIVSGSDAMLGNITASNISSSGELYFSSSLDSNTNYKTVVVDTSTGKLFHTGSYSSGGGGSTPTLQQVTNQGASTTNNVEITGSLFVKGNENVQTFNPNSTTALEIDSTDGSTNDAILIRDNGFERARIGLAMNGDEGFIALQNNSGPSIQFRSDNGEPNFIKPKLHLGGSGVANEQLQITGNAEITGSLKVNGDITAAVTNTSRLGIILKPSTGTTGATQFAKIQDSNGNDIITRQQGTVHQPHELWIGRNTGYQGDNNIIINGPGNVGTPSFNQTDLGVTSLWVWQGANTYGQYITGRTQDNTSTALLVRNWNGSSGVPNYETYFQLRNDKFVLISGSLELTGSANISNDITASGDILIEGGGLSIKNDGAQSYARFYCESNNFHYTEVKAQPHSLFSGNPIMLLPAYDFDFAKPKFVPSITASADISSSGDIFFNPANATTGTSVLTIDPTTGKVFRTGSYSAGGGSSPAFPFTGDAEITGSLTISGSSASSILIVDGKTFFKGQVSVGNSPGDSIDFTSRVTSDFIASGNNDETLGTRSKPWYGATITSITGSNISASGDLHAGLVDNNDTGFRVVVVDTETGKFYRTGSYAGGGGGSGENYDLNATTAISSTTAANLNLTSTSGTDDSVVKIEAGPNITINRNSATEIAISGSGGGGTDVNTATKIFVWYNTIT